MAKRTREEVLQLLDKYRHNLHNLELQAADYGGELRAPLDLVNLLQGHREQIEILEAELSELESSQTKAQSRELLTSPANPGRRIRLRPLSTAFVVVVLLIPLTLAVSPARLVAQIWLLGMQATPTEQSGIPSNNGALLSNTPTGQVDSANDGGWLITITSTPTDDGGWVIPKASPTGEPATFVVTGTGVEGIVLRSRHSTDSVLLETLPDGTEVTQIGADFSAPDRVWRKVRAPDGTVGWVAAEFLKAKH